MIDASAVVAKYLISEGIENVAADELPATTSYPAVLVRQLSTTPAVPGTLSWDVCVVQVDVIGQTRNWADGKTLVGLIRDALAAMRGQYLPGPVSVQGFNDPIVTEATDDTVSPARPRWVLVGDLLARSL